MTPKRFHCQIGWLWIALGCVGMVTAAPSFEVGAAESPVRLVDAPANSRPIRLLGDQRGRLHLACDSAEGPIYAVSSDQGASWSPVTRLVDSEAKRPGLEFSVWDMVVEPQGRAHVALGTNAWKLKLPHEQWGFHYTQSDPRDGRFAALRNINRRPSEGFSLAADGKGNVAACWLADRLYVNLSTDGGETFLPTREIDSSLNPCNCCTTSAAYGPDGRLAILYREETNDDRDMFLVLWDVAKDRVERKSVSQTTWKINACPMTYYSLVSQPTGYLAVWPTRKQVYFARLDKAGTLLEPGELPTSGQAGMRTGVLVLTNRRGEFLIAWNGENKIGWQVFDSHGKESGTPGQSAYPGKGIVGFVADDGQFVLVR